MLPTVWFVGVGLPLEASEALLAYAPSTPHLFPTRSKLELSPPQSQLLHLCVGVRLADASGIKRKKREALEDREFLDRACSRYSVAGPSSPYFFAFIDFGVFVFHARVGGSVGNHFSGFLLRRGRLVTRSVGWNVQGKVIFCDLLFPGPIDASK